MWLEWLAGHRKDVSVVADDGRGHRLAHNADVPRVLASTVKVVHLLAYTTAVAEGRLDPDEPVPVGDWDAWHPFDGDGPLGDGAHYQALTALGVPCDEYGVARNPERHVPLCEIARAMIRFSDNAAPDYLRTRLGDDLLRGAASGAGWPDPDIRWFCGETLRSLFPGDRDALAERFTHDPAFRRQVFERVQGEPISDEAEWDWTRKTAHGTAAELFALHRTLATASTRPAELARRMLRGPGGLLFKGGALMRTLGFGMSVPGGTVAMLLTGTDFPAGSLVELGEELLRDLPRYAEALGVRAGAG